MSRQSASQTTANDAARSSHPLLRRSSTSRLGPSNHALQQQLQAGLLHPKLTINQPHDPYEQEADRVADTVIRMPDPVGQSAWHAGDPAPVQRKCSGCEEEEVQLKAHPGAEQVGFNQNYPASGGQNLPASERAFFEPRFGRDFGGVRVHTDGQAVAAARSINALAYTKGSHIVFGDGQYRPQTFAGRRLLAHELTHVAQQSSLSAGISQSIPAIQRGIGDGHDLQSPWLAGDPRLEDIFDNDVSKFLRRGSTGTSVKRVQQLLFFLGFDIGVPGADGIFGPLTDAAVRDFQTRFAPPVDGIIGPITIGALDREANQPEPNRTTPRPIPTGPSTAAVPPLSVDRIDLVDSAAGAIGGFPAIQGNASLNTPGPFNDANQVNNSLQVHFHLDNGNSANLTPVREIQRTATVAAGAVLNNPPDEVLPPGVAGPTRQGGFTGVLIANDGPAAHEIQRPTADTIVVADAPGLSGLVAASFPVTYRAHFILTVNDALNAPIARINYDVLIERRTQAEIPNTENRVVTTAKKDFVRGKDL
jgi:peptidoglycan hydrolase-like protein with peptidoglycan-binding domain